MPMPAGIATVTVTGRFVHPDGSPLAGTVTFSAPSLLTLSGADTIATGTAKFTLDGQGMFTATLIATDNTNMQPTGWAYQVVETLTGVAGRSYWITLPSSTPTVDLADLAPADPARGSYVLVPGPQGDPGTNGSTILSGHGAPSNSTGSDGDYWMDLDATTLYGPKASGAWPGTGVDLIPTGLSDALNAHTTATTSVHGIADTAQLETKSGAQSKADAAQTAATTAATTAAASDAASKYLPLSGGTLPVTQLPPTASSLNQQSLKLGSTFGGGENDADSTGRLTLESYQRAQHTSSSGQYAHYGEVIRIYSRRWDSKQMIAWYGPTAYNGDGTPATADTAWFWMGAHYEANDHASVHGHWSVEVPDTAGNLQTRMELRIWDPTTGTFGMDRTILKMNAADVVIAQDNGALYLAATAGTAKNMYFTNDTTVVSGASATGKRWGVQADSTAEAGSNVGTDFRVNRYSDTGVFVDSPVFIKRSTGVVGIGNITAPAARLDVTESGSRHTVEAIQTTTSANSFAAYAGLLGLATNRLFDGRVSGDTSGRLVVYPDGFEIGDGTNPRDVAWKRTGTAASTITGSLTVTGTTTVNGQPVGQNLFAKKTANEVVNNSASMQDDDHLTVTVAANAVYELTALLIYDGTTTADLKAGFTGPSGATLDWVTHSLDATAGSGTTAVKMTAQTISGTPSFGSIGAGSKVVGRVSGLLTVASTGGTFKVQWAQNTAEATDTTMYAGSYLSLRRIS